MKGGPAFARTKNILNFLGGRMNIVSNLLKMIKPSPRASAHEDMEVYAYGPIIFWERNLQIILKQFLAEGDTVLDLGANICGLSIALARIVGKSGFVHAFECNPKILAWAERNLAINNVGNVALVKRAAYSESNKTLDFICEDSHYGHGSTLKETGQLDVNLSAGSGVVHVKTISVDDYCASLNLKPTALKIDVEGAEFDVLKGAVRILEAARPVLIFEQSGSKNAVEIFNLLSRIGYSLYDTATLQPIDLEWLCSNRVVINILGIYQPDKKLKISREFFFSTANNHFNVPSGVFCIACSLEGTSALVASLELFNVTENRIEAIYETKYDWLKSHTNSNFIWESHGETELRVTLKINPTCVGCRIKEVTVWKIF